MSQSDVIAELCGWRFEAGTPPTYGGSNKPSGWRSPSGKLHQAHPNYTGNLNAMRDVEELLFDPKNSIGCSSNPEDHAPRRYLRHLANACGLKVREELVLRVADNDKGKLSFRPGPYPIPIQLPASAVVLGHRIPAYGHELCLIRATALQRAEAFLRAMNAWKDEQATENKPL